MRNVVLTFKVSEEEAAQIRSDAGPRRVSAHIRACVLKPTSGKPTSEYADHETHREVHAEFSEAAFKQAVAKHKLRHPTATAERMARKELDVP